jgi:hypothetical protein
MARPTTPSPSSAAVAGSGTMFTETELPADAVPKLKETMEIGLPLIVKVARPGTSAENVSVAPIPVQGPHRQR